ncbi:plasmid replication initiator protein, partial [Mycobacteroides abscessus subsp. abscessus]
QTDWESPIGAVELATIIQHAARTVTLTIDDPTADTDARTMRFGTQIDTQPLAASAKPVKSAPPEPEPEPGSGSGRSMSGRLVARYLAKYVTKSLVDLG